MRRACCISWTWRSASGLAGALQQLQAMPTSVPSRSAAARLAGPRWRRAEKRVSSDGNSPATPYRWTPLPLFSSRGWKPACGTIKLKPDNLRPFRVSFHSPRFAMHHRCPHSH